jgi:hypothetical protein
MATVASASPAASLGSQAVSPPAVAGRQERRSGGGGTGSQCDQAQFDQPEPQSAMRFGNRQRGPALFDRGVPERLVAAPDLFDQAQQPGLVHSGIEYAARFGRDRLLPFVVENRHRWDFS